MVPYVYASLFIFYFNQHLIVLIVLLCRPLPLFLSLVMGLQHAFAMVGGLITPPYVVAKFTIDGFPFDNVELQQYFIVAALITRYALTDHYLRISGNILLIFLSLLSHQWHLHSHQYLSV